MTFSVSPAVAALATVCALAIPAASQTISFPMTETGRTASQIELQPNSLALREIAAFERVMLTGVPLPEGGETTLTLRRLALRLGPDAIRVDGSPDRTMDPTLSLWAGRVVGQSDSYAYLAFSNHGSRGWFGRPGQLHHLLAQPDASGDWTHSTCRLVTEQFVQQAGPSREFGCQVLTSPAARANGIPPSSLTATSGGPLPYYDAPIAFETDYEFYALFNNIDAAQAYVLALIGSVSDRYRLQTGVIFTLPYVGFHTTNTDPWTDSNCFGRLDQFRLAWRRGGAPVRAQLYHLISGVPVSGCGGVAYLNVICDQNSGFGMSAHINTNLTFPPVQGPLTWDYFVLAHELGHNFGTNHTHSYSPPIDSCASGNCGVAPNGTIMSYCHTCSGGMRNIDLTFHPRVVTVIRNAVVNSCLQPFHGVITADLGFALDGSNGTPVQDVTYSDPTLSIDVTTAPASEFGAVLIGLAELPQPFLGGTLVPRPDLALPLGTNASGMANYSFPVNATFPAGITIWAHSWFNDPSSPNQFAASNASRVELIKP